MTIMFVLLGLLYLEHKNEFDPLFLFYLVLYDKIFLKQVLPLITGSNYPAVNGYELLNLLPPSFPNSAVLLLYSQVDEVIEKEQKYKEKLERIKWGLMEDLLTGRIRVNSLIEHGYIENGK